ncbi:hypothetical protein SAY86_004144 [Trapa natans]|uniref:Uncharacterized protein n=1 Tax=Trapa natans TaxID=22666 RepID=A0AAN7MFA9_TRANT|nr:hypothetical protein SAY86_004144 [Trapa natans]
MDCRLSIHWVGTPRFMPSSALKSDLLWGSSCTRSVSCIRFDPDQHQPLVVAAAGPSPCESSSLNSPLVPRSPVGKYLSRVFQNQRQLLHVAVFDELKLLADERDSAVARMILSEDSDEAALHRRIAELKEHSCRINVEDVMYILILCKFSQIKVPLVPKLSSCIYNGRLEIFPVKDWELESIHSPDSLEMVRSHVNKLTGLSSNSSVSDLWATTHVRKRHLSNIYVASILYGYFLKSVSTRHQLEQIFSLSSDEARNTRSSHHRPSKNWPYGWNNLVFRHKGDKGHPLKDKTSWNLSSYLMGFDSDMVDKCGQVQSLGAKELIERQTVALFGETRAAISMSDETDLIITSFSSMKRLFLEAVAFGSFLSEVEHRVDSVYPIRDC